MPKITNTTQEPSDVQKKREKENLLTDLGITKEDLDQKQSAVTYHTLENDLTSFSTTSLTIQAGWGYIDGAAATSVTKTITFPASFKGLPISVLATPLGHSTSEPTSIEDFTNNTIFEAVVLNDITRDDFLVTIFTTTAGNLSSSNFYGFSWLAIG